MIYTRKSICLSKTRSNPLAETPPTSEYYFDVNANMPLLPALHSLVGNLLAQYGNASAPHYRGQNIRGMIEQARVTIMQFFGNHYRLVFTSGATEANNLWLYQIPENSCLIMPQTEHPSLLQPAIKRHSDALMLLPVNQDGAVDMEVMQDYLAQAKTKGKLIYLSVQAAHSETGIVQNIKEIFSLAKQYDAITHCDMVQLLGKYQMPADGYDLIDYITISAHKIGGLQGAGALLYRDITRIKPMLLGGTQEQHLRAGTENFIAITCFAEAIKNLPDNARLDAMLMLRNRLEQGLITAGSDIAAYGAQRIHNTVFAIHPHLQAQQILMQLDLAGINASNGSACSSGKVSANQALLAMGYDEVQANRAVRFSFGNDMSEAGIDKAIQAWQDLRV
ncbi:MAG: aminotransferase class V-fold PLP-dependent enzyme [Alphaproteobacteria bacterium]|nr:aminotransferase class V-fold PLP-dependent enzyme [Alphaproteobacteria bacterium]